MKKLFTLAFGLFTFVLFAAGREPSVTLTTSNNHEVWIDGKNYFSQNSGNTVNIPNMQTGRHTIEVYQVTNKIFRKDRTLVTRSTFDLRDRDLIINVDNNGRLDIQESGNSVNQQNDRTVTNSDGTRNIDGNNSDRRSRGRGHKYGHNKEWKKDKMKNKELKNKELKNKDEHQDDLDKDDDEKDDDKESKTKNKPNNKSKSKK